MDALVTGGGGFIGSNLVAALVREGRAVRVLDNFATGRRDNLADVAARIDLVEGDLRDGDAVRRAVRGVRHVFHMAALPSVAYSVEDPLATHEVNSGGTLRLLLAARDAGVERFVFSSSSSVYGDTPVLPKREDMTPTPLSPYAAQKLAGEHYARIVFQLYGLKTFALRYFNVYGPRQNPQSHYAAVIPLFIETLRRGGAPRINGDGGQTRDFAFVEDVVRANLACAAAPESAAGRVFNIGGGGRISINELAAHLIAILGRDAQPEHGPARPGDIRDSQADVGLAARELAWRPQVGLEEGLRRTAEWFAR